jgi:hypothetical protein
VVHLQGASGFTALDPARVASRDFETLVAAAAIAENDFTVALNKG